MDRGKFFTKLPFYLAGIWALVVSLYILLAPHGTGMGTTMSSDGQILSQTVSRPSFFEVQGPEGIAALAVFALIYLMVALCAYSGRRALLAVTSLMATVLTFLAGFSIGLFYFPAMFVVMLGWMVIGLRKLFSTALTTRERSG